MCRFISGRATRRLVAPYMYCMHCRPAARACFPPSRVFVRYGRRLRLCRRLARQHDCAHDREPAGPPSRRTQCLRLTAAGSVPASAA